MPQPARVLYIGDVPVENTVAGAVQMYRLLKNHPPDHLRIIESGILRSAWPGPRLPGVRYDRMNMGWPRLLRTRFCTAYATSLFLTARLRGRLLCRSVRDWKPQAVLSVVHGITWLTAAAAAQRLSIPLHLIIHDDPLNNMWLPSGFLNQAERAIGRVYRQAATRLCVSPAMADLYKTRFGAKCTVLYPVRDPDAQAFDQPPERLRQSARPLVFAYAGSVSNAAYSTALTMLADVLEPLGHRMLLFSNWGSETLRNLRLDRAHVTVKEPAKPGHLVTDLREQADVLFVPMSFEPGDAVHVQTSFPSKLTDYTAAGLPLLIWGPPNCSAVKWATDNPGVAEIVVELNTDSLKQAIGKLTRDPQHLWSMGHAALSAGNKYFSPAAADRTFSQALGVQ